MDGLKVYLDETRGKPLGTNWTDIPRIPNTSGERLGYPTQKPLALLSRIISASTDVGDVVLDPFCGCGTAIDAAEALGRHWVGIDVTHLAIGLIKHRLVSRYGPEIQQSIIEIGEPTTVDDAAALAADDPFQFEAWALGLVGARTGEIVKGGDKGIDGRLLFHETRGANQTQQIILSVKAGHVSPSHVRDLRGVLDREGAQIGVLISFEAPTAGMRVEAASAGFFHSTNGNYPRIQLRSIAHLLDGRGIQYPPEPATVYRPTLFSPEEVPTVARPARQHSTAKPPRRRLAPRPVSGPRDTDKSPHAERLRQELGSIEPESAVPPMERRVRRLR